LSHIVDFDYHAVDFVLDFVPVLAPIGDSFLHFRQTRDLRGAFGNR